VGFFRGQSRNSLAAFPPQDRILLRVRKRRERTNNPRSSGRKASGSAIGTESSRHDRAPHYQRLSGPVVLAFCPVDLGSGRSVAVAKIRSTGFGLDGGTLFASLGSDPLVRIGCRRDEYDSDLVGGIGDGMSGRNVRRKFGTTRWSPSGA
jgi:hypothetical protein